MGQSESGWLRSGGVRSAARVLAFLTLVGAVVWIASIVSGSEHDLLVSKTAGVALAFALLSLGAAAGASLIGRSGPLTGVGYLTVAVAVAAFVIFNITIWSSEGLIGVSDWSAAEYSLLVAFGTGVSSALLSSFGEADGVTLRLVRATAILAVLAMVGITIVEIASPGVEIDPRLFSTFAVLFVVGAILTVLEKLAATPALPSDS